MPISLSTAEVLRRVKTSTKKVKGLPKRHHNPTRKAKMARYLGRSTCFACKLIFRSPKYKRAHDASGHHTRVGVNPRRQMQ